MKEWMFSPILISEFQVSTTGIHQSKSIALSRPGIFIQDYFSKKQKLPLNLKPFSTEDTRREIFQGWGELMKNS